MQTNMLPYRRRCGKAFAGVTTGVDSVLKGPLAGDGPPLIAVLCGEPKALIGVIDECAPGLRIAGDTFNLAGVRD